MTGPTPEGPSEPRHDEPEPRESSDRPSWEPWASPERPPAEPWAQQPSSDPTAPAAQPHADSPSFDPYRFGPPGPNPFGYPPGPSEPPSPSYPPHGPSEPPYASYPPSSPPPHYPAPSSYPPPPPYPPYGSGYPPPSTNPYAQPSTGNGRAIAALVLGLLSMLLFWLTVFDVPLFVLGIIFGVLGIRAAKRGAGGKSMATAGLITAIIGAVACLAFTGFIVNRVVDCGNTYDSDTSAYDHCLRNGS